MRVQSSLTITQGVGHGFYEGVELAEELDVEHVLGVRVRWRVRASSDRSVPGPDLVRPTRRSCGYLQNVTSKIALLVKCCA